MPSLKMGRFRGSLIALLAMILLVTLTSPLSNIMMGLIFFGLALFLLISLGYSITSLGQRVPSRRTKLKVSVISTFIVLGGMLLSVQSLNWASGLTLVLLAFGMLFYTSRRS